MAENTKIEWAHHTFNPWIGCQAVSPGCDNCYAKAQTERFGGDFGVRRRTSEANWKQPIRWNKKAEKEGIRYRVFCASLADVFDNAVPPDWREELFEIIRITPNLDWLLLTKRPQNIVSMVQYHGAIAGNGLRYLPKNVWLGTTAENQDRADTNISSLLLTREKIGATVLFVSIEPMLGPIDLYPYIVPQEKFGSNLPSLDWVIVGGESGRNARPMHPDWPRKIRDDCKLFGVPFMFKQWGEHAPNWLNDDLGNKIEGSEWIDRMGKKSAGRLLDGVLHDEFPEVHT